MKFTFAHNNINVLDLEKSLMFYKSALGLEEVRRHEAKDGSVDDYAAACAKHKERGVVCYENPAMGICFIEDPDGYWLEVVPEKH